jgi:perosamine synthetase
MFVTSDDALYEKVMTLSNHGRTKTQTKQFWPDVIGYKYKMSNLQAAVGCAQMERFDELVARKRQIFKYYEERLGTLPLRMNPEKPGTVNGFWMPTIVVDQAARFNRESLLTAFRDKNIDARGFFWPLSMLPMFTPQPQNEVSYSLHTRALNLPSYHDIDNSALATICDLASRVLGGKNGSNI